MPPSPTGRRSAWILAWLACAAAAACLPAHAADAHARRGATPAAISIAVPDAGSFAADAAIVRAQGIPILAFYTRADCSWCDYARRVHLAGLATEEASGKPRALVREVDVDGSRPLTDFAGRATTHARFAKSRRIRLTPTLEFLDDRGNRLAESIVGVRLKDYYGSYIERAIEEAQMKLGTDAK